jgi:integrase
MPRRSSGPRLWFDKTRKTWSIIDGKRNHRTGFTEGEIAGAEKALADYTAGKHVVAITSTPLLSDVLSAYLDEHVPSIADADNTTYRINTLNEWWGDKRVSDINAVNCRAYAASRPGLPGARRDLEVLRAAVNYWHKEKKPLAVIPAVVLPEKSENKDQWLTREQQAKFLWAARRMEHLKRFLIVSWYTGSRSGVVFGLTWDMIDEKTAYMRRKPHGARKTKKRAPPIRIGARLLSHLKRWKRLDKGASRYVVHYNGAKVGKLKRSFYTARDAAGLPDDVTPHTMRHSAATHLMREGADYNDAAQFLGMSVEMLVRVYGHHHPDWQAGVADLL